MNFSLKLINNSLQKNHFQLKIINQSMT